MTKLYHVEFDLKAKKQFNKLDHQIQKQILFWLKKNIEGTDNPRLHGKALVGDKSGLWRYRVGKYRIICNIQDDIALVLVVQSGTREIIYDK